MQTHTKFHFLRQRCCSWCSGVVVVFCFLFFVVFPPPTAGASNIILYAESASPGDELQHWRNRVWGLMFVQSYPSWGASWTIDNSTAWLTSGSYLPSYLRGLKNRRGSVWDWGAMPCRYAQSGEEGEFGLYIMHNATVSKEIRGNTTAPWAGLA